MSLAVDVLPVDPLPIVRLLVSLPQGRSWKVTGSAGDVEWLAGEGRSSGQEEAFSDPWAPLGRPITYTLTAGSGAPDTAGPVLRSYRGQNAITDLTGRRVVDFAWHPSPGNPRSYEPRVSYLDPWGSPMPVVSAAPTAGVGGGDLAVRTVPPFSRVLEDLTLANRPVIVHHSHSSGRCPVVDCDIEAVQTVMFTKATQDRRLRPDVSERVWTLSYRLIPKPYKFLAPVATWADVVARWSTNAELLATGMTNLQLARGDWLVEW